MPDLGRQGHRAAREVATEDGLTGLGRPHGQGGSAADEVGAHGDGAGENQGRGERRCWQTGSSKLLERCAKVHEARCDAKPQVSMGM